MQCPSCAAEVADGNRFCNVCGAALPTVCLGCGYPNASGSNFCGNCGAKIGQKTSKGGVNLSPAAGTAERRQVTVIFCDLVGSTPLSTQLDPEDLREVIGAYYKEVAKTVHRCGGFVAQYSGDGVLVYFGYPQAKEQDAEWAVRAGLELIPAVATIPSPIPLQSRIGIATGLVVVGHLFGSGEMQGPGIIGETPNLAARLQSIADPNMVVIDEATRRLIGDLFELRDLGARDLKGLAAPVRAWAALRPGLKESRFDALHATGLSTLVGREEECELILRRWSRALNGEGQVVLLSGEGGIGKSRLAAEVLDLLEPQAYTRTRYFCSPQHTATALYPFISQLQWSTGLLPQDAPRVRLDKLDNLLARTSTPIEDRALFAELLTLNNDGRYPALALGPQQRRQRMLSAFLVQLETLADSNPILVLFEDAHWIDPTSLELLGRLVDRIAALRGLLIVTFRPDLEPAWVGRSHVTILTLNRLAQREIGAIIDGVVGNKPLPPGIRQDIIDRTDGIPLFVEEMTKAVLESASPRAAEHTIAAAPITSTTVPASLHASLMARLDRLGSAKEVVETAAAIGREFSHTMLASVARQPDTELTAALERLVSAGLVVRQGVTPHATYRFKHALVQEAAYGTLLRARRETLHARIAEVYEHQFGEVTEGQPELFAHHLERAGLAERAIAFWLKAARDAIGNGAIAEAVAQLRRGLDLVGALEDQSARRRHEIELRIALGNALMALKGYSALETDSAFRRARELCLDAGEMTQLVRVLWGQFSGHFAGGRERASLAVAHELLALSERLCDVSGRQMGHASVGASLLHLGSFAKARAELDQALALDQERQREWAFHYGQSGSVVAASYQSLNLLILGFPDQARRLAHQSLEEARRLAHPPSRCFAHSIASRLYYLCGDRERLAEHTDAVVRLADEHGLSLWQALGRIYAGWSHAPGYAAGKAIDLLRAGLASYRAVGAGLGLPLYYLSLAMLELRAGNNLEAQQLVDEAQAVVDAGEEGWLAAEIHRVRGETMLLSPEPDVAKAQSHFERAVAVAREQQSRLWELRAATSIARLWRNQSRPRQAGDLLGSVYGAFTEGFDASDLKEAKALLDALG